MTTGSTPLSESPPLGSLDSVCLAGRTAETRSTANVYSAGLSEVVLGKAIKAIGVSSGWCFSSEGRGCSHAALTEA